MSEVDSLIQRAQAAIKVGRRYEGRQLLEQALAYDEHNVSAWLWMSACVESLEEQKICLENVLTIDPDNQKALKGLEALERRMGGPQTPPVQNSYGQPAPQRNNDPFAGSPFSAPQPPSAPPAQSGGYSSVEWGNAPAAPQPNRRSADPSPEEYDNWVNGLNLNRGTASAPPPTGTPFTAANFEEEDPYGNLDDILADIQRTATTIPAQSYEPEPDTQYEQYDSGQSYGQDYGGVNQYGYGREPIQPEDEAPDEVSPGTSFSFKNPRAQSSPQPQYQQYEEPDFGQSAQYEEDYPAAEDDERVSFASAQDTYNAGHSRGFTPPEIDVAPEMQAEFARPASRGSTVPGSSKLFAGNVAAPAEVIGTSAVAVPVSQVFRAIPAEIVLDEAPKAGSSGGGKGAIMVLTILNVVSLIGLIINLIGLLTG